MSSLKPVSTRSAVLSLLLGAERPSLSARELVLGASLVGFAEPTVRVALSRMTAAGDLVRDAEGRYALSERLVERQRRQDEAVEPHLRPWDGDWEMVVVTATGRGAAERSELRARLTDLRLAELREGVWTRPANLDRPWPADLDDVVARFLSRPEEDPAALAARLWDLDGWALTARDLLAATDASDPTLRFTACATSVRHLLTDPVLPEDLLPADWPGAELRASHLAYKEWLIAMRQSLARESA